MKILVLRDYSGEEGRGPDREVLAGSEHVVSRARGNALKANGLVAVLEDDAETAEAPPRETKPAPQHQTKPATTPARPRTGARQAA